MIVVSQPVFQVAYYRIMKRMFFLQSNSHWNPPLVQFDIPTDHSSLLLYSFFAVDNYPLSCTRNQRSGISFSLANK